MTISGGQYGRGVPVPISSSLENPIMAQKLGLASRITPSGARTTTPSHIPAIIVVACMLFSGTPGSSGCSPAWRKAGAR